MADEAEEAMNIANEIEAIILGRSAGSVMYAVGMVIANGISQSKTRDVDDTMRILKQTVEFELKRQFTN